MRIHPTALRFSSFSVVVSLITRTIFLCALGSVPTANTSMTAALLTRLEPLQAILTKWQQTAERQHRELCTYSVDRRYTIQNAHLRPSAVMNVRMTYQLGKGKHFETPSMPGVHGLARRSLLNLLQEEERTSREQGQNGRFNTTNYDFALLGVERLGTHICYRLKLKPRRTSKYLIDGEAWIDAKDYVVIQVKGHLSQKPSFWVQRPAVEQLFEKVQNFWLPSYNRSLAQVTFVGETVLTMEYSNYQVTSCPRPQ